MFLDFKKYILDFRFDAGTSRGVLKQKTGWFLKLRYEENNPLFGIGECSLIPGLSPDDDDLEPTLKKLANEIRSMTSVDLLAALKSSNFIAPNFPSIRFGLEVALNDLHLGGIRMIYKNDFVMGNLPLPINGLVWMGDKAFMSKQLEDKIKQGYTCIKLKVGAIDLDAELLLVKQMRERFSADDITIRLDANGAFTPEDALETMHKFAKYDIHSIEQPIMAGQWDKMARLCRESPLPIALDEELIGVESKSLKIELLNAIKPKYIILKPSLMGGLSGAADWIQKAEDLQIGWWITSALESNIGLNAIAQFTAEYQPILPQGLGTGQLYHNNFTSPLQIENGFLYYNQDKGWDLTPLGEL